MRKMEVFHAFARNAKIGSAHRVEKEHNIHEINTNDKGNQKNTNKQTVLNKLKANKTNKTN